MSTPNKELIAAIQRIAEGSPLFTEVRGLLKEIQRRGGIEGLSLKIGADDESGGDCCTDPSDTGQPADSTAPDISGDAPPDMSGGTPEGWTDCETGDAIQFTPAGFAQAETCKEECKWVDELWRPGVYFSASSGNRVSINKGAYRAALNVSMSRALLIYSDFNHDQHSVSGLSIFPNEFVQPEYAFTATVSARRSSGTFEGTYYSAEITGRVDERDCTQSQVDSNQYGCAESDPPIEDNCTDWEPDSTTNYTLANGCIVASSCDTDASEQAKQCNEQIIICDENGNERVIQSIGNGQFIMYDPAGVHRGGRYNAATGERLEILDPGSNGGYGSIE